MAFAGQVVANPVTRQSLRFVVTGRESGGREVVVESVYNGPGREPIPHFHPSQEEFFEVLEGSLTLNLNGQLRQLGVGATVRVAPGEVHAMWNATPGCTRVRWITRPALRTEEFLETVFNLAEAGHVNAQGVSTLLQTALLMDEYAAEFQLARPAKWVQRLAFGVARLLAPKQVEKREKQ